jgi:plastocyanin
VQSMPDAHGHTGKEVHDHSTATTQGASGHDGVGASGLASVEGGYRLVPSQTRVPVGREVNFTFRILDRDGHSVTSFVTKHERDMHLIVVRRDLSGFQHLHPAMAADGTWTTGLRLPEAGVWRVFADFATEHGAATLGVDAFAAGRFDPVDLPEPAKTATADGYQVTVEPTGLAGGQTGSLTFRVARDGQPVTDLEPYLGARGHLVALREGDLAYLHVHPTDAATEGASIGFGAELPSAGRYRLYLQFQHHGQVRTAAFTLEVAS